MILGILAVLTIGLISLIARLGMTAIARGYAERHLFDEGTISVEQAFCVNDESIYRNFFEVSADAFVIFAGNRVIDCNEAALKFFGYSSKEEFSQLTPVTISPEYQQNGEKSELIVQQRIEEALEKGGTRFEWLYRHKDKTLIPTEVTLNTFVDKGRTIILASIRDSRERKREKADLQRAREDLEMILNSVPFGVAIVGKDKKIHKVNRAAREMIGYQDERELIGHICHKAFCPAKEGQCPVLDLGNTVDESEKTLVTRLGYEKPILKSVTPISFEGKEYLLESFVDITKQKHNEGKIKKIADALEASNKSLEEYITIANSATRAKSEFLANMSHEIRTPMTAILGFADLLKEKFSDQEEIHPGCGECVGNLSNIEYVNTIYENGQHLLRIMNDILDLSKIEAEKIEIEHAPCSPRALMDDVKSLMEVRSKAKGLPLKVEYSTSLPDTVSCDKTRIRQILINLLANAIKFTEIGSVRAAVGLVYDDENQPFLQFDVIDTGIGMSEEQVSKIFKPFEQADSSTSRKFGGTGLGLTISKRLAELLGGDLVLTKSTPGQGSTFTFTTAVEVVEDAEVSQEAARFSTGEIDPHSVTGDTRLDCRVLLAEDGVDNQRLISLILQKAGAEVVVAENGMVAFDAAIQAEQEERPFDVILMDMQMPVMDGYEAVRKLRLLAYSRPIIALTAHAMAGDSARCKEAGCDDYFAKPIEKKPFLAMVAHYAATELQKV